MGFDVIDKLVEEYNVPQSGVKFNAMYGKGRIEGQPVILMKPLSYMNLSGGPVRDMANYFKIDPETEMIVIYDDIDLEPGQLRIRKKGSAGGHNGIKHIIQQLGTQTFVRIKVGVGAKPKGWDLADHVLGRFGSNERKLVEEAQERACKAVEMILADSVDAAMNQSTRKWRMYEDIFAASAESCRDGRNTKTGKKESWNSGDQWLYGVPESSSYVWAFRAFSMSSGNCRR